MGKSNKFEKYLLILTFRELILAIILQEMGSCHLHSRSIVEKSTDGISIFKTSPGTFTITHCESARAKRTILLNIYIHAYTHTYIRIYISISISISIYIYIYIYIHIFIYSYIHIFIHSFCIFTYSKTRTGQV